MFKNILLISTLALSALAWANPEITTGAIPEELHIYSGSGDAFVRLTPHGCSGIKYIIPNTHTEFDAIFSLILAAQLSEKQIKLRFDGCNANNQGIVVGAYLP